MDKSTETVTVSAHYLLSTGLWDAACDETGYSIWAVNEGMDSSERIALTIEQAERIGLVPVRDDVY